MLALQWRAFWTPPPAELLEQQRMVRPPTLEGLAAGVGRSAAELAAILLLVWRGRLWAARVAVAGLVTATYFVWSAPAVGVNSVEQVHRRWLAFVAATLLAAGAAALLVRLGAALRRR